MRLISPTVVELESPAKTGAIAKDAMLLRSVASVGESPAVHESANSDPRVATARQMFRFILKPASFSIPSGRGETGPNLASSMLALWSAREDQV